MLAGDDVDPREVELRGQDIRVVGYREDGAGGYGFRVEGPIQEL